MEHFVNESSIVALAFIAFAISLYKPSKKFFLNFLDSKILLAIKNIEEAAKMRNEAELLLAESKKQFSQAKETSLKIVLHAKEKALSILEATEVHIKNITEKKTQLSIARIAQQEKQIIDDFKNEAIERAIEYVENNILQELDKSAQLSLIENSIKNIKKLVH